MANVENLYETLGIQKDATLDDVKKAYKQLALQYHPDKNSDEGAEEAFKKIGRAYGVLSDARKRAEYDRKGEQYKLDDYHIFDILLLFLIRKSSKNGYNFGYNRSPPKETSRPESKYAQPEFKSAQPESKPAKPKPVPETIEVNLGLNIFEVFNGCEKTVKIIRTEVDYSDGSVKMRPKHLNVTVIPGVKAGSNTILKQSGNHLPYQTPSDVIIIFQDIPHKDFKRNGSDVYQEVTITEKEAKIGGQVTVKLLDKTTVRTDFGPITKTNTVRRFPSLGLPIPNKKSKRGDMIITFKIKEPINDESHNKNPVPKSKTK